ncbi:MAG: DUF99 family protein [Candidatus Bathyarchaeia archaeon]
MKVLAVEDGGFSKRGVGRRSKALLLAVLTSQSYRIEKILYTWIQVDGLDATDKLIEMAKQEKETPNLILLASLCYAGFNIIDPTRIQKELNIPVVAINPKKPRNSAVTEALRRHFNDWRYRVNILRGAGKPVRIKLSGDRTIYFYHFGIIKSEAEKFIRESTIFGKRPEPLRIARILAHEISKPGWVSSLR